MGNREIRGVDQTSPPGQGCKGTNSVVMFVYRVVELPVPPSSGIPCPCVIIEECDVSQQSCEMFEDVCRRSLAKKTGGCACR